MPDDMTLTWEFPKKGLDLNFAYYDQPQDTTPACLNVMPYDPAGQRARGGQRAGTAKLFAAAMGSGAANIQCLMPTTVALDPALIQPATTLVNENWAYANGAVNTVAAGVWTATAVTMAGVTSGTTNVTTGTVPVSATGNRVALRYIPALTLGSSYIVRASFFCGPSPNCVLSNEQAGIILNVNPGNLTTTGSHIFVSFKINNGVGGTLILTNANSAGATFTSNPGFTYPPNIAGIDLRNATSVVECQVQGQNLIVKVNGVIYINGILGQTMNQNQFAVVIGDSNAAAAVFNVGNVSVFTGQQLASYRQSNLVSACGGQVYVGSVSLLTNALATNQATVPLSGSGSVQACYLAPKAYFVDGYSIVQLDITTSGLETYSATTGTAPTLTTLCCIWRGRLVLAAPRSQSQQWFMSRVGVPTDWDYGQVDSARAIAGTSGQAFGYIGDPITALIPFTDDQLIFGGDHNIWQMTGDPAAGGNIDIISDGVGVLGPNAWCRDPEGNIYFVGPAGFYKMTPGGGAPANLSATTVNSFFASIDRGTNFVSLAWDRDRHGCWIHVTPVNSAAAIHMWYDLRTGGFWYEQYPNTHGPMCCCVYDGDAALDRAVLLGGRTGLVQRLGQTYVNDDGTAITSNVTLGPIRLIDATYEGKIKDLSFFMGNDQLGYSYNVDWTLNVGNDAQDVLSIGGMTPIDSATGNITTGGYFSPIRTRLKGGTTAMVLSNSSLNKTWSFERSVITFTKGGKQR